MAALAYCDPGKNTTHENDAREYDIGSAFLRGGKPFAFSSRSLSERRYAQIENETLASLAGWRRFTIIPLVYSYSWSPITNR